MAGPFFSFYFALILMHDSFINLLNMYISSICVLTSECIDKKGQNIIVTERIAIQ